ncbi:MAG TPA: methyltransferase [Thermoanaerobaculia bacterium]|nr:methyltransferase [Thermoanaerobaculia bacterium]
MPGFVSRATRDAVRELLDEAGYREDRICRLLDAPSLPAAIRAGPLVLGHRTAGGAPLNVLVRLFLGGFAVSRRELVVTLGSGAVAALEESRLFEPAAADLRPTVELSPIGSLVIASDRRDRHAQKAADFVLGPGPVTRLLADLTIRRPAGSTLDLCCGAGVLGLLAAAHSERVVATDLSPRAVAFARFNAELNGVGNVETAEGDLFAPVRGRRFDLILCNPPYVISPGATFLYRDGGGEVCERIAREASEYLTDQGCLEMLCNWPEGAGTDWREGVLRWFEGTACDAWVLRHQSVAAPEYAAGWLAQEAGDGSVSAGEFAAWTAHLESLGADSVGGGLVVMRPARGRTPWREARESPPIAPGGAGDSIARTLAARDLAARNPAGRELLEARLRPSPDLELVFRDRPTGEGWDGVSRDVRLTRGLRFAARLDPVAAALVGLLDGRRTVREAVSVFAGRHGVSPELFLDDAPRAVRELLHLGLLIPDGEA